MSFKDTDTLANEFNHFFISVGEKVARDSAELAQSHGYQTFPSLSQTCDKLFEFKAVTCEDT